MIEPTKIDPLEKAMRSLKWEQFHRLKAESRVMDLESQCASMRLEIHNRCDHCRACVQPEPAFSADAGRKLTERVQALERVALEFRRASGLDGTDDWSDAIAALGDLDTLEAKR